MRVIRCKTVDHECNRHFEMLVEKLRQDHKCKDPGLAKLRDCMYRHGGSIRMYAQNVLRERNHDQNTWELVKLVATSGTDDAEQQILFETLCQFLDKVCMYTDSFCY